MFALSDIHVDFQENKSWVEALSPREHRDDILILAGDVSDSLATLRWCFETLTTCFAKVFYVPGNHELWVIRNRGESSIGKFQTVCELAASCGVIMQSLQFEIFAIVPFFSWYDYSFGPPTDAILASWMDFYACSWPANFAMRDVAEYFLEMNKAAITKYSGTVITFSHFLPRIDLMPFFIPPAHRIVYPVLGTKKLDIQIREVGAALHIYGHSHVNQNIIIDGIRYVNNAFGYPREGAIASKKLVCVYQDGTILPLC